MTWGLQADLMSCIKKILFPAALESLFGSTFLRHHGSEHLQKAFFAFEEGFELAASPVPHFLQPPFCKGRRALLEAFRLAATLPLPARPAPLPPPQTPPPPLPPPLPHSLFSLIRNNTGVISPLAYCSYASCTAQSLFYSAIR